MRNYFLIDLLVFIVNPNNKLLLFQHENTENSRSKFKFQLSAQFQTAIAELDKNKIEREQNVARILGTAGAKK